MLLAFAVAVAAAADDDDEVSWLVGWCRSKRSLLLTKKPAPQTGIVQTG